MLDGVPMNVINAPIQVVLILAGMLPEAPLPQSTFPLPHARRGEITFKAAHAQE